MSSGSIRLLQAAWHPGSNSDLHVVLLTSDNTLRYELFLAIGFLFYGIHYRIHSQSNPSIFDRQLKAHLSKQAFYKPGVDFTKSKH